MTRSDLAASTTPYTQYTQHHIVHTVHKKKYTQHHTAPHTKLLCCAGSSYTKLYSRIVRRSEVTEE